MPCECGPETRTLWEQVRDFMQHHDQLFDQYQAVTKERDALRAENEVLLRQIGKLANSALGKE